MDTNILFGFLGPVVVALITAVVGPLVVAAIKRRDTVSRDVLHPYNNGNEKEIVYLKEGAGTSSISMLAIMSLVLGLLNLCSWYLPICGVPMSMLGIIFGFSSMGSPNRGFAIAGVVLSMLGLIASIINSLAGVYLYYTGQYY